MVLRLVVRNRLRTVVGMFAASMGAGLLVCGFMLGEAMTFLVSYQYEQVSSSDIDLGLTDEHGASAWDEARGLPGVDAAEPLLTVAGTFSSGPYQRKGGVTGLLPGAHLTTPRNRQGDSIEIPDVGLVMSRKLAELLHVAVGDTVVFQPSQGRQEPYTIPVTRITDNYLGLSTYADIHYLSRLLGEELAVNGLQLKADPSPKASQDLYAQLKQLPAIQAVNRRSDVIHNLRVNYIDVQYIFISLMVFFAGVIFFGSILNAALIGLAERRREVATLLVLGYTPWKVGGLFLRESMLVTLLGTLAGLPLGYLLTVMLSYAYDTEMFRFPVIFTQAVLLKTLFFSITFGLLAHLGVQRSIHKLDCLDALNVKE
jgi:putative ABC transport system permease protein